MAEGPERTGRPPRDEGRGVVKIEPRRASQVLSRPPQRTDRSPPRREQVDRDRRHVTRGTFRIPSGRDEGRGGIEKQVGGEGRHGKALPRLFPGGPLDSGPDRGGIEKVAEHGTRGSERQGEYR